MVACDVSAVARDRAGRRCTRLGLNCDVWGGSDLDIRLQPQEDIVAEFFHLPPTAADFTGREAELTQLTTAIESGGATILGLRGMGGVGKTVLALKLAEQLKPRYPDAQFYLDLRIFHAC